MVYFIKNKIPDQDGWGGRLISPLPPYNINCRKKPYNLIISNLLSFPVISTRTGATQSRQLPRQAGGSELYKIAMSSKYVSKNLKVSQVSVSVGVVLSSPNWGDQQRREASRTLTHVDLPRSLSCLLLFLILSLRVGRWGWRTAMPGAAQAVDGVPDSEHNW